MDMKYDILLFDADNTILDFDKSEEQALRQAFDECSLPFGANTLPTYRKNNIRQWQLFEQGIIEKSQVLVNRFAETFAELNLPSEKVDRASALYEEYLHYGYYTVAYAEEVLEELKNYPSEDIYIIGGASIYRQFLPYCKAAHVTKIDYAYEADTYFPNLDEKPEWSVEASSGEKTYYDLEFEFVKYCNSRPVM